MVKENVVIFAHSYINYYFLRSYNLFRKTLRNATNEIYKNLNVKQSANSKKWKRMERGVARRY